MRRGAFVYQDSMSRHVLRDDHVFKPCRLRYTYELLHEFNAFEQPNSTLAEPRYAEDKDLYSFHTEAYVAAVKAFGEGQMLMDPNKYNFSRYGDNPIYPGMYEASVLAVGGSLVATELLLDGQVEVAFNVAGGLHHAAPGNASGFCVFNDAVLAIKQMVAKGLKIAYVDIDVHHGDGVQAAFYDTASVLTISVHESGRYIFPGTGFPDEIGIESGTGFSANLPLAPYTCDDVYVEAFSQVVPPLVNAFDPDVLVTQLGIDTYQSDPLGHLNITTKGFTEVIEQLASLSDRWLALGGGGYDVGSVARCWSLAYGLMVERQCPDYVPEKYRDRLGTAFLRDQTSSELDRDQKAHVRDFALKSIEEVKQAVFPFHGL